MYQDLYKIKIPVPKFFNMQEIRKIENVFKKLTLKKISVTGKHVVSGQETILKTELNWPTELTEMKWDWE